MKYIICDLDGTLYNVEHRLHLLQNCRNEEDYDKFHAEHINDKLNTKIRDLLNDLQDESIHYDSGSAIDIIFITGRHEKFRKSTVEQLNRDVDFDNNYFFKNELYMKPSYEIFTPDFVRNTLKEIFEKYGKENCYFVLDDRPATVQIYRDAGLLCLQVQNSTGFLEDVNGNK